MLQETFGINYFGRFKMFNTVHHNQMQQLNQVTNNYILQKKNEHNDIEEELNVVDLKKKSNTYIFSFYNHKKMDSENIFCNIFIQKIQEIYQISIQILCAPYN